MVEFLDITKIFNKGTVDEAVLFDNFNLSVKKGEFVSIVGSNGSGKTTLLNLLCGTLPLDGGKIFVGEGDDAHDVTKMSEYKRAKSIGRVFQDPKMGSASALTILENMALADNKNKRYSLARAVSKKRLDYYKSLISECNMGLEDRMDTLVGSLSGGQRQALALVMANMTPISILVLDEHTAALDPKSSETIMQLTDKFVKGRKVTAMMVTHNLRHAVEYGNRLIMMDKGHIVLEKNEDEKKVTTVDSLLGVFNEISVECGN